MAERLGPADQTLIMGAALMCVSVVGTDHRGLALDILRDVRPRARHSGVRGLCGAVDGLLAAPREAALRDPGRFLAPELAEVLRWRMCAAYDAAAATGGDHG